MEKNIDGIFLFSGGLDSILGARLLADQGLNLLCLHFISPFFGKPEAIQRWRGQYGLNIEPMDISGEFVKMLTDWPEHGPGKVLNPCMDCKILMLRKAAATMAETGAQFVASGEVVGQRPMSQRVDAMNTILKASGLAGRLLRPLCAPLLAPTLAETGGLVNRELLPRISGRGRLEQLALARKMGIVEIPTPGGGCKLTEQENARRYWTLIQRHWQCGSGRNAADIANDFRVADLGRALFHEHSPAWLCVGRKKWENDAIFAARLPGDIILRLPFPGPLGLLRACASPTDIETAAGILASYSPRARNQGGPVTVRAASDAGMSVFTVPPSPAPDWFLPSWPDVRESIRQERKKRQPIGKKAMPGAHPQERLRQCDGAATPTHDPG